MVRTDERCIFTFSVRKRVIITTLPDVAYFFIRSSVSHRWSCGAAAAGVGGIGGSFGWASARIHKIICFMLSAPTFLSLLYFVCAYEWRRVVTANKDVRDNPLLLSPFPFFFMVSEHAYLWVDFSIINPETSAPRKKFVEKSCSNWKSSCFCTIIVPEKYGEVREGGSSLLDFWDGQVNLFPHAEEWSVIVSVTQPFSKSFYCLGNRCVAVLRFLLK